MASTANIEQFKHRQNDKNCYRQKSCRINETINFYSAKLEVFMIKSVKKTAWIIDIGPLLQKYSLVGEKSVHFEFSIIRALSDQLYILVT